MREDVDVERHLKVCRSCWRIAEALRPATDTFEEALPPIESRQLPGYHCRVHAHAAIAAQTTPEPSPAGRGLPLFAATTMRGTAAQRGAPLMLASGAGTPSPWVEAARMALFFAVVTATAFIACYCVS
jgi:hypothetical protein